MVINGKSQKYMPDGDDPWGWISSVGSVMDSLTCVIQRLGFDSHPNFSLGLTWDMTPFP